MNYSIEFYEGAYKYIQKLDKFSRTQIVHSLQVLSEDPFQSKLDIKKM
jgi:mRNA-degrading endonuclease RelE of RelBE toxin-antitoxin system